MYLFFEDSLAAVALTNDKMRMRTSHCRHRRSEMVIRIIKAYLEAECKARLRNAEVFFRLMSLVPPFCFDQHVYRVRTSIPEVQSNAAVRHLRDGCGN